MKTLIRTTFLLAMLFGSVCTYAQYNAGTGSGTVGTDHTFVGVNAGAINTGAHNTFLGQNTGRINTSGTQNTFVGRASGYFNTTGKYNTFSGVNSGYGNTTGQQNVFVGQAAGRYNSTGHYNTFIGRIAGYKNKTGSYNTFIGRSAGYNTTAGNNTFLGYATGFATTTGTRNLYAGNSAGRFNKTGTNNTCLGYQAGYSSTAGVGNVFIGYQAGFGELDNNKLYIDNSNTAEPLVYGDFLTNEVTVNGNFILPDASNESVGNFYLGGETNAGEEGMRLFGGAINGGGFSGGFFDVVTDNASEGLRFRVDQNNGTAERMRIRADGKVVIGNDVAINNPGDYKLYVDNGILTEKVKVATVNSADWADYVFEEDYELNSIEEVEQFVKTNKHLPNVPSAKQVEENGIDMVEMDATLLRQVEELWLHLISLKQEIKELKLENEELKK